MFSLVTPEDHRANILSTASRQSQPPLQTLQGLDLRHQCLLRIKEG
jgi:hypothetical protein